MRDPYKSRSGIQLLFNPVIQGTRGSGSESLCCRGRRFPTEQDLRLCIGFDSAEENRLIDLRSVRHRRGENQLLIIPTEIQGHKILREGDPALELRLSLGNEVVARKPAGRVMDQVKSGRFGACGNFTRLRG